MTATTDTALYRHPLQCAMIDGPGCGRHGVTRWHTEHVTNAEIAASIHPEAPGLQVDIRVERYNRCPTCEEWSPCGVRRAMEGRAT